MLDSGSTSSSASPIANFIDEDLNRVWNPDVLNGPRITAETSRARELRPFIDEADFLLDIHSMQHKTPALTICGQLQKGQKFAKAVKSTKFIVSYVCLVPKAACCVRYQKSHAY